LHTIDRGASTLWNVEIERVGRVTRPSLRVRREGAGVAVSESGIRVWGAGIGALAVIQKGMTACARIGVTVSNDFREITEEIEAGSEGWFIGEAEEEFGVILAVSVTEGLEKSGEGGERGETVGVFEEGDGDGGDAREL
jgi:hypothetical protein